MSARAGLPAALSAIVLVGLTTALASACSSDPRDVDLGRETPPPPGSFTSPDASSADARIEASPAARRLCIATECPVGYATCGTGHKCTTDTDTDTFNCGECGHECPYFPSLGVSPRCSAGKCKYECADTDHIDCNGLVEDGCEVSRRSDPNNCGSCGHVCPAGVACLDGTCGCPTGLTQCDGFCADLQHDIYNCKTCGNVCPELPDGGPPPPHMLYTCDGECGVLACENGWADCDKVKANGCEVNVGHDAKNCGACGKQCQSGQTCAVPLIGAAVPTCMCGAGLTFCDSVQYGPYCADLLTDNDSCGACDNECSYLANTVPNMAGTCKQGRCDLACLAGFADCDGDRSNGCEVNLMVDGTNCGACGNGCATAQGQPCVKGSCLMIDCDADGGQVPR